MSLAIYLIPKAPSSLSSLHINWYPPPLIAIYYVISFFKFLDLVFRNRIYSLQEVSPQTLHPISLLGLSASNHCQNFLHSVTMRRRMGCSPPSVTPFFLPSCLFLNKCRVELKDIFRVIPPLTSHSLGVLHMVEGSRDGYLCPYPCLVQLPLLAAKILALRAKNASHFFFFNAFSHFIFVILV